MTRREFLLGSAALAVLRDGLAAAAPDARLFEVLIGLSRARIVSYIPARRTPSVTYTQMRIDSDNLHFTPEVYEQRRDSFERRIKAMKDYVLSTAECRSRILLSYFGEKQADPCGRCDNCRRRHPSGLRMAEAETIARQITDRLADGTAHDPDELSTLPIATEKFDAVLRHLMAEGIIVRQGCHICLSSDLCKA